MHFSLKSKLFLNYKRPVGQTNPRELKLKKHIWISYYQMHFNYTIHYLRKKNLSQLNNKELVKMHATVP